MGLYLALYNRTGTTQTLLGLGWNHDAGNRNKWNFVFGLGLYILNYRDRNHPGEDTGLEASVSDRKQIGVFGKIQNMLQIIGFQVRYDF